MKWFCTQKGCKKQFNTYSEFRVHIRDEHGIDEM